MWSKRFEQGRSANERWDDRRRFGGDRAGRRRTTGRVGGWRVIGPIEPTSLGFGPKGVGRYRPRAEAVTSTFRAMEESTDLIFRVNRRAKW